jgi:hypothetical protein
MIRRPFKFLREIAAQMLVGFCAESTKGTRQDTPPLSPTTSLQEDLSPRLLRGRSEGWTTADEEKPHLFSRSPSPDYAVGDQLEEEMNPSTTYWRTITSLDLQEDPFPLSRDPWVDYHHRLDVAHQMWQGPLVGSPHSKSNSSQDTTYKRALSIGKFRW